MSLPKMKLMLALGAALSLSVTAACGDDEPGTDAGTDAGPVDTGRPDTGTDAGPTDTGVDAGTDAGVDAGADAGMEEVVGEVNVTFTIDDSENGTYETSDGLAWKGSMSYDSVAGKIAFDPGWGGPFPPLYDDGTHGDATAGDGIWTITALVDVYNVDKMFEYGAIKGSVDGSDGSWIWNKEANGNFAIPANTTTDIVASGMRFDRFGDVDMRLVIDSANLHADFASFNPADGLNVKSSAWGWTELPCVDDGTAGDDTTDDGLYTFALGANLGIAELKHNGLLNPGDMPEFVFVLGGVEYKVGGNAEATGVTAQVYNGSAWVDATISLNSKNNTSITVPTFGFTPPAGHVALNFWIDDSNNQTYDNTDGLAWKGSMAVDSTTRVVTKDTGWGGPFALLYDDGPWALGGHEPSGSTAGDNVWGTTVWFATPAADEMLEYGAIRGSVDGSDGDWIWVGGNGTITIPADGTGQYTAAGLTIEPFGTTDMRLTLDTANLDSGFNVPTTLTVKGSAWGWSEIACVDDGTNGDATAADGIYSFALSYNLGKHDGLLKSGDAPEWVFVLDSVEYKCAGVACQTGVGAELMPQGGAWADATIVEAANGNTSVVVP